MIQRSQMTKALSDLLFQQRENNFVHNSFNDEMRPYELIRQGDMEGVTLAQNMYTGGQNGVLSDNPVRNKQYLFVATITVLCRVCIESGMGSAMSFGLSDLYIRRADKCTEVAQLDALNEEMLRDYTERMRQIKRKNIYSIHVLKCMEYIEQHLQETIRIPEIANSLGISPSYLSKRFSRETGLELSAYIREKKLEAAKLLLLHSDYSCTEIAEYFAFSSSAHFSKVFRERTGYSPLQYRNLFYQKSPVSPDITKTED